MYSFRSSPNATLFRNTPAHHGGGTLDDLAPRQPAWRSALKTGAAKNYLSLVRGTSSRWGLRLADPYSGAS